MDILIGILLLATIYWLYKTIQRKYTYFESKGIPTLKPTLILGNMGPTIFRTRHISDIVKDMYNLNENAKYVGAYNFMTPTIVIRDLDLVKSVTIKNFDHFTDHQSFVDETLDPLFGKNIFSMKGDRWREARNMLSPAFTSSKMKTMFELMVPCAENTLKFLQQSSSDYKKAINSKDIFTKYTNDVIATCAFGLSIDSMTNPTNDFYVNGKEATNLDGIVTLKFMLSSSFPGLMKFFKIKFLPERVTNYFQNVIESTIKTRDDNGIRRPDVLQLLMDARGKDGQTAFDSLELTAQAFIFFFAGFDTTSTQMSLVAHELAVNPDVQKKLQAEIDQVLAKTNGKPTYESISGMAYLDAVFSESLRLHPQVTFLDRICTKDFELPEALPGLEPLRVKAGSLIWIPVKGIHSDPKYYDNPEKFDPDRFLGKRAASMEVTSAGFGLGPRMCIGNRFAILETKLLFFYILSKFNLRTSKKTCVPIKYAKSNFSISAEGGFWISAEPRL